MRCSRIIGILLRAAIPVVCIGLATLSAIADDVRRSGAETSTLVSRDALSCAALMQRAAGAPCQFDFTKFRTGDLRLDAIEGKGSTASGLFTGRIRLVRNATELRALHGRISPGDQIVLADGTWKDAQLTINANGTPTQPVLVRAETLGGVTLVGKSSLVIVGSNIVVRGLAFKDGTVERSGFVVLSAGTGEENPCNDCLIDKVSIDGYNSNQGIGTNLKIHYLITQGRNITVANSEFRNKQNPGTMILAGYPRKETGCQQQFKSSDGCFMHFLFLDNVVSRFGEKRRGSHVIDGPLGKDYKIMQLGWSGAAENSSFSVIEGNTFEFADGENETVSIKASDVLVRRNLFRSNTGTLNLRSANRVLVEDNVFDGITRSSMGGVRIEGRGHWIVNNHFRNLSHPINDYYAPIAIHTASQEELVNNMADYARAVDIVIAANTFENVAYPVIVMGIYPRLELGRTLRPKHIFVVNNQFGGARAHREQLDPMADVIRYVGSSTPFGDIIVQGNSVVP